jgi:class 3 adenylate cyclase
MENPALIGRFGIGFLSSFIVADHVRVVTRKYGTHETWLWETHNKQDWSLEQHNEPELNHGTWIRLYFRDHYDGRNAERVNDLKTVDGIEQIIRSYCYLIPFPIQVGLDDQHGRRVNAVRAPWDDDSEAAEAFKVLFGKNEPFYTHRFDAADPKSGNRARGVLYFRPHLTRVPSVQLYVKRMLVDPEDRLLIPPYAIFVSGLLDCPQLEVDLSRRKVSPFDPIYKWLRRIMLAEFERAFLAMTQRRFDDFVHLWPRVDNSFIVHLMDAYRGEDDSVLEEAACSFLRNAGHKLPFYLVDLISGSQGRPIWCTIEEAAEKRRRELANVEITRLPTTPDDPEHPVDDRGRVRVYFTRSQQPVEKDILIQKYGELLDVGRAEKAHELVLTGLKAISEEFEGFDLVEVNAAQFTEVPHDEQRKWDQLRQQVERGLVFAGRSHEVVIETYEPKDAPIVITDTKIDTDQVKALRDQLQGLRGAGQVGDQLLGFLAQLEQKGGNLIIHVNARNPLLVRLREGLAQPEQEVRQAASQGLSVVAWRAVLDYFGWTSTRDMIARDRSHTNLMISALLDANTEISALRAEGAQLKAERDRISKALKDVDRENTGRSEAKDAICGFIDMVDSTRLVMANPSVAPEQKWDAFRLLTEELQKQIAEFGGTTVSFTGDGVLFVLDEQAAVATNVIVRLANLAATIEVISKTHAGMRTLFEDAGIPVPKLRSGLSFGKVFVGGVGPTRNLIGLPVVEAARISAEKELFAEGGTAVLVSESALDRGAQWKIWRAGEFERSGSFVPKGFNYELQVFRPR